MDDYHLMPPKRFKIGDLVTPNWRAPMFLFLVVKIEWDYDFEEWFYLCHRQTTGKRTWERCCDLEPAVKNNVQI